MNKVYGLLAGLLLAGCSVAPAIVPDDTTDSVIMMKLKHEITNGDQISQNWGWILWYLPVMILVLAWAWKELINKPIHLDDKEDAEEDKPAEVKPSDTPPSA
jgi:hypothetical protein